MKMRINETRRHQAAFGIDLFIDRLRIVFADELDAITLENDDTIFDDLMFSAVEADHVAALDKRLHYFNLSKLNFE
jgi:hypothetical protein